MEKFESRVEQFESAIDLHSDSPCKDYRMRRDVGQSIDDEDPYAEKDRLQKQLIKENPQEELSRLLQAVGTIDIGAMEVPAAEWRLTSVATARFLPRGIQEPVEEQQMIQALTDSSFKSVCVC